MRPLPPSWRERPQVSFFMRASVLLVCMSCLLLCGIIVLTGRPSHRAAELPMDHNQVPPDLHQSGKPVFKVEPSATPVTDSGPDAMTLIRQIKDALNSGNPGDQEMIFTNQLSALINADPWAAAQFAESLPAGLSRTDVMRVIVQNWSESNPGDSAKWVSQLADSNERNTVLSCLCFQVARADPKSAIQILEQQGIDDDRRKGMLGNLAQQWASQDLPAALAWAGNYGGEDKDNLVAQIALAECKTDPAGAATLIARQISPGAVQDETALSIVNQWAQTDVAAVTSWVDEFPAGELHDQAIAQIDRIAAHSHAQSN